MRELFSIMAISGTGLLINYNVEVIHGALRSRDFSVIALAR